MGYIREDEPEIDDWERALWRAFYGWESGRCLHCGNQLSECLRDDKLSELERARWVAGYQECRACEVLELSQQQKAKTDRQAYDEARKRDKEALPPPTGYRLWGVWRDNSNGR